MAPGIHFPSGTDLWEILPAGVIRNSDPSEAGRRTALISSNGWIGRMRPGVTAEGVRQQLTRLNQLHGKRILQDTGLLLAGDVFVQPFQEIYASRQAGRFQVIVLGTWALFALVLIANAFLLAGSAERRAGEWATREALGARPLDIARQLGIPVLVLLASSTLLAMGLSVWLLEWMRVEFGLAFPELATVRLIEGYGPAVFLLLGIFASLGSGSYLIFKVFRRSWSLSLQSKPARPARALRQCIVIIQFALNIALSVAAWSCISGWHSRLSGWDAGLARGTLWLEVSPQPATQTLPSMDQVLDSIQRRYGTQRYLTGAAATLPFLPVPQLQREIRSGEVSHFCLDIAPLAP